MHRRKRVDLRALVLIASGVGVLVLNWGGTNTDATPSDLPASFQLSTQTSCVDTPPNLALFFNLPMPVNQAMYKDLVMLPGIGPRMAARILDFRAKQGSINGWEDLDQIQGFGPATTKRLRPLLCFDIKNNGIDEQNTIR